MMVLVDMKKWGCGWVSYYDGFRGFAFGVATDSSGNIIVTGHNRNDYYTVKYSDILAVISCDSYGNEVNQFTPGQDVYVQAVGLEPGEDYTIWIQDSQVNESDALAPGENPSTSETPEIVAADSSGNIPPTLIWSIPSDASVTYHEYDIVFDKLYDGLNTGTYNSASDGIDAADVVGFTAPVPEVTPFIMLLMGIVVILGYVRNHNRGGR